MQQCVPSLFFNNLAENFTIFFKEFLNMRIAIFLVCLLMSGCASMNEVGQDGLTGHDRVSEALRVIGRGMKGCPDRDEPCNTQRQAREEWQHTIHRQQQVSFKKTCFLQKEVMTGNTKQCIYNCLGETFIMTKSSYQLCDITIEVD